MRNCKNTNKSIFSLFYPGEITEPPDGSRKVAVQGKDFTIKWKFSDPVSDGMIRQWYFKNASTSFSLCRIRDDDDNLDFKTDKLEFEITKPASLVLKNVDLHYNGTYTFALLPASGGTFISTVLVFVAGKLSMELFFSFASAHVQIYSNRGRKNGCV